MKNTLTILLAASFLMACNTQTGSNEAGDTSVAEKIDYAYIPENHPPDYWDRGDQKNVAIVLNSLKAFEAGNIDKAMTSFADTVLWSYDGFDDKIAKDSMKAIFNESWKNISSIKIKMGDYESVISKDKKEEYVTLWFKEIVTDKSGKTDSLAYVADLKIENGKITELDEKTRKYPVRK